MNSTHPSFPSTDLAKCGSKPRVTPEKSDILESRVGVLGSRTERSEPEITNTRHSVYVNIGELQRGTAGCEVGRRIDQRSQAFEPIPGSQESVYELQDPPGNRAQKTESYEHSENSILEPDYLILEPDTHADSCVLIRHKISALTRIKSVFPPKNTNRRTTGDERSPGGQDEHSPTNTYEYFAFARDSTIINDNSSPVSSSVSNSGRKTQLQTVHGLCQQESHTVIYWHECPAAKCPHRQRWPNRQDKPKSAKWMRRSLSDSKPNGKTETANAFAMQHSIYRCRCCYRCYLSQRWNRRWLVCSYRRPKQQ